MQSDKIQVLATTPAQLPATPPPPAAIPAKKRRKKHPPAVNTQQAALLDEYFATMARMRSLREFFQRTTDPDLISACVYEMNAVQQQYGYILGRLKAENVTHLKILR